MKTTGKDSAAPAENRMNGNEIIDQKCWQFIRELNSDREGQLDAVAMIDCDGEMTYRQMFRMWDRYAEVFSALGIVEKNRSRVGIVALADLEPINVFYALNMLGVSVSMIQMPDLLDKKLIKMTIRKERITDIIVSDIFLRPDSLRSLLRDAEKWGIRHVIVLHSPISGEYAKEPLIFYSRINYCLLRQVRDALFMDDLLRRYAATPICYGSGEQDNAAAIIHTSGTTDGIHKPIPLSDKGLNAAVYSLLTDETFGKFSGRVKTILGMELATSYGLVEGMHLPLAFGGMTIAVPLGRFNDQIFRAVSDYETNVSFMSARVVDEAIKRRQYPDFSALEFVFLGGYSISSETKERVNRYLKKCGASIRAANGYGISEAGGACIVASPDREDDAIGYPLPGVKVKIYDEEEDTFYNVEDGPRTGVLFISSDSVSSGIIDDVTFFHTDEIDGERYLNTYDLVRVNEDQSLTCVGRMNKYFVNNEGIRFDAGLIETAVSAEPRVASCGLAPEYFKSIHDTVAVLYVEPVGDPAHYREYVRQALLNVFVRDQKFRQTELPSQCVITENIPYNASGKVDTHQIMAGGVEGRRYIIKAIRQNGDLTDIRLLPAERQIYNVSDGIPEELRNKEYERIMRLLKGFDVRSRRDAFMGRRNEAPGLCGIFDEMMSRMFAMYDRRAPYRRPFDDEENCRACSRCRNRRFDLDDEDEDDDFSDDHDPDFNENLYDSDEDEYDDDRYDYISGRRRDRRPRMRRLMEQLMPILFDATVYDRFYED